MACLMKAYIAGNITDRQNCFLAALPLLTTDIPLDIYRALSARLNENILDTLIYLHLHFLLYFPVSNIPSNAVLCGVKISAYVY